MNPAEAGPESAERPSAARRRRVRRVRRPAAPSRQQWGNLALVAAVVFSALAFGAQHTVPLILAAACAATSAVLLGAHVARPWRVVWLFVAVFAFTALQLVPLPSGLVEWLSPASAAVWRDAFTAFGEPAPSFVPLTVDPAGTALELVKWSALACGLLAAVAVRSRGGAYQLAALVFASATAVGLVTAIHGALDATRIYGFVPVDFAVERWSRGPLLNGNHLAGYANLGFFTGLGLLLGDKGPLPRWVLMSGCFLLAFCVLLSMSRAGLALLGLGGLVVAGVGIRRSKSRLATGLLVGAIGAALLMMLGVTFGGDRLFHELKNHDVRGKAVVWTWALALVRDFPWFGVGRGAFDTAFQPYRQAHDYDWTVVYSHPENLFVQCLSEWGIPFGTAALLAFGFVGGRWLVRYSHGSWVGLGLRIGMFALIAQNLVDFSLEVFAVALLAVVAFAAAGTKAELTEQLRPRAPAVLAGTLGVAALLVLVLGASPAQVERRKLAAEYRALPAGAEARARLRERVQSAVARHPGESYFPLLGGLLARLDGKDPLPFLARALERGPINGTVHLALASALAERGVVHQALMHLRLAARHDVLLREQAVARAASWGKRADVLASAFPQGQPGGELLGEVCHRLRDVERLDCLRIALSRDGTEEVTRQRLAVGLMEAAEARRAPCADFRPCRTEILALLHEGGTTLGWLSSYLRARLVALDAEPSVAVDALLAACPARPDGAACAEAALSYAERSDNLTVLKRAAERYEIVSCPGGGCARARDALATAFTRARATGLALEQRRAAAEEEPTAGRWLALAEAAVDAGAASSALVAIDRALSSGDVTEQDRARASAARDRLRSAKR